jgi:lysylphosphatidylglycerol synthetase-like protein (DUF2156 family)
MAATRRRYRKTTSSSRSSGWLYLLLLVAIIWIIVKLFWWIVGAIALVGLFFLARAIMRENRKRRDAYARYCAEIVARADQQHNWVMQGDDRGFYGPEGAELMHYIRSGGAPAVPMPEPPVTQPRRTPFGVNGGLPLTRWPIS